MREFGTEEDLNNADLSNASNNEDNSEPDFAEYVLDIETFLLDNSIEIDWTAENYGKLFTIWGHQDLDRTNMESVYNTIASVFARNVDQKANFILENLFDVITNVDTYLEILNKRMTAFGIDSDKLFQINEMNRNQLLDLDPVYDFIFTLFENFEFQKKLNVFIKNNNSASIGWYKENLADKGAKDWIHQAMPINACSELINFFNAEVMTTFRDFGHEWNMPFVMNLLNCIRYMII